MAFKYGNYCFSTIDPVVDILTSSYSASYKNIVMTPNAVAGTIAVSMRQKSNNSLVNTTIYVSGYCDEISERATFDKVPINDILMAGIFVCVLALGFSSGLRIRK